MLASTFESTRRLAVVNWTAAIATVKALAHSAEREALPMIEPMIRRLLAPLCQIEEIARLSTRAISGDERAMDELHRLTSAVLGSRPGLCGLFTRFSVCEDQFSAGSPCYCSKSDERPADLEAERLTGQDVLEESTLVELVLTIMSAGAATRRFQRMRVLDTLTGELLEAGPIVRLARAHRIDSTPGLLTELRTLAASREMTVMMNYSGGVPDLQFPNFQGDKPSMPDLDLDLQDPAWPSGVKPVHDIIAELRKPTRWDREYWQPFTPFEPEPVQFFPPGWQALLDCLRAVARRIQVRAALSPPPRPARVVWADGITGIEQSGACVGNRVIIRGSGFAALRSVAALLLPFHDGCHPVDVPAADWTDTSIRISLPPGISSGPIGFADAVYVAAYAAWVAEQDRLAEEIRGFFCYLLSQPLSIAVPFRECPPDRVINRLRAGEPVIKAFTINGLSPAVVEPGTSLVLDWTVRNAEKIMLERNGSSGPAFGAAALVTDPAGQSFNLGPFNGDTPVSAVYTLTATGPCGQAFATVEARLRKVPSLRIMGVEVTQGIQKFRSPDGGDNSIELVASKDTVVRVYVVADNLNGFKHNYTDPDQVRISGELRVGMTLAPTNTAMAQPDSPSVRAKTGNTLNFRLPAALAQGTKTLRIHAWTADELESPPSGDKIRPTSGLAVHAATWIDKVPLKVRYVRISLPGVPELTDPQAREVVVRAFDLLATPPLDIAPARIPTWHTGEDLTTRDGVHALLEHIDDQHDCTLSEALFFWEEDCPDDDGAVWVAVTPRSLWGGMAQGWRLFDTSRNTAVVPPDREVAAHELGHTLKLNHVNVGGGFDEGEEFDTLPNGGAIRAEDAFDPFAMKMVLEAGPGFVGLYDFMSYAQSARWVSPMNWRRVFNKF
jgi:hypothetical protein